MKYMQKTYCYELFKRQAGPRELFCILVLHPGRLYLQPNGSGLNSLDRGRPGSAKIYWMFAECCLFQRTEYQNILASFIPLKAYCLEEEESWKNSPLLLFFCAWVILSDSLHTLIRLMVVFWMWQFKLW